MPDLKILWEDIRKLEKKHSMSYEEIACILNKESIGLPVSIFSDRRGSFESIVKYLIEDNLSVRDVALLTGRKQQEIRTTYNRARKKSRERLDTTGRERIPLSLLSDRKFSVLEHLVKHLLSNGHSLKETAAILKRNYQTIWTIKKRL